MGLLNGCSSRHRLNLTAEIVQLKTRLNNLEKTLQSIDNVTINKQLAELGGKVNILQVKVAELELIHTKHRENRNNFIVQILILVLSSIIISIIGITISYTWTGLKSSLVNEEDVTAIQIRQEFQKNNK